MALRNPHADLNPADFEDEEDLSREQMRALLQRAEKRLRATRTAERPDEDILGLQLSPHAKDTKSLPKCVDVCPSDPYH